MYEDHPCVFYGYPIHGGGIGLCGDLMGSSYSERSGSPVVLVEVCWCRPCVCW